MWFTKYFLLLEIGTGWEITRIDNVAEYSKTWLSLRAEEYLMKIGSVSFKNHDDYLPGRVIQISGPILIIQQSAKF